MRLPAICECIDGSFTDKVLMSGESYLILEHDNEAMQVMVDINGNRHWFNDNRFLLSPEEEAVQKEGHVPGGSTPQQYGLPEGAKELQDLIEYRNMNFAIGNIFKACYRMGTKDTATSEYDLNKIIFFAQRELARIRK